MAPHTRRDAIRAAGLLGLSGLAGCAAIGPPDGDGSPGGTTAADGGASSTATAEPAATVRVPADEPTIQAGVDAAEAGDLVLVSPGTFAESIVVDTPRVTLRGVDRNGVVLDGEFGRRNGVEVIADGVALENLTARYYRGTGFYWSGVRGFRGSFLTAYSDGYYGIYAYDSRDGRFEHSYASGHPDAGFYLGRHRPYEATVADVVAEHNAIGYSGTSTGEALTVRDSVFRRNRVGVFPNTLDTADPPQRASRIVGNHVYENDDRDAPVVEDLYPLLGMGILLWGASGNLVADNRVADHDRFGIVAQPNVVPPSGNEVRDNRVSGSGIADLALGTPSGEGNRFAGNEFGRSLPADLEADASAGSEAVEDAFAALERRMEAGDLPAGDWREQPEPGAQPSMADPEAPPRPANRETSLEAPRPQVDGFELG